MPPSLNTIREILDTLNGGPGINSPWIALDGFQALTTIIVQNGNVSFNPASGIVVKSFLNTRTSEVKTYAAKYLGDVSERGQF